MSGNRMVQPALNRQSIVEAARAIAAADALLITAGAGMGVDSGLPDFRGTEGFWRVYPAIARLGLRFEEFAQPRWFKDQPELAWAFYGHRYNLYQRIQPHDGFKILLEIARSKAHGSFVFTSNVDGHFQKAGFAEDRVVECHGSLNHRQCLNGCGAGIWPAAESALDIDEESFRCKPPLPICPSCKGLARPNVLMFGDWEWLSDRTREQHERFDNWLARLKEQGASLAVLEFGAGKAIPTVRMTSEQISRAHRAKLIRVNLREAEVPSGHIAISSGALQAIQEIAR